MKKILGTLVTLGVLGAAGFLVWKYVLEEPADLAAAGDAAADLDLGDLFEAGGAAKDDLSDAWDEYGPDWDFSDFTDVLDGLGDMAFGDLFNDDPMLGDTDTLNWREELVQPDNGGLHLTLRNALDEEWQTEFDEAVADWQKSDALVLTEERVAVDNDCTRVDGVMVVCNANFGETGWVGINENSVRQSDGVIVSSVAKMNEYYLHNADFMERRYTMCHELGHGFGLPHTDENPRNANLGDCLDYTDDPEENIEPGEVNMVKLRGMYLTSSRRRVQEDGTVLETTHLIKR